MCGCRWIIPGSVSASCNLQQDTMLNFIPHSLKWPIWLHKLYVCSRLGYLHEQQRLVAPNMHYIWGVRLYFWTQLQLRSASQKNTHRRSRSTEEDKTPLKLPFCVCAHVFKWGQFDLANLFCFFLLINWLTNPFPDAKERRGLARRPSGAGRVIREAGRWHEPRQLSEHAALLRQYVSDRRWRGRTSGNWSLLIPFPVQL